MNALPESTPVPAHESHPAEISGTERAHEVPDPIGDPSPLPVGDPPSPMAPNPIPEPSPEIPPPPATPRRD